MHREDVLRGRLAELYLEHGSNDETNREINSRRKSARLRATDPNARHARNASDAGDPRAEQQIDT